MKKYIIFLLTAILMISITNAANYVLDKTHSVIMFQINNYAQLGIPTIGRFKNFEGILYIDEKDFTKSNVKIKVFTNSLDTGNSERDRHLLGEDFFNAEKYPLIEFYSTSITPLIKDNSQFILNGRMVMLGTEKEISTYVKKEQEGKNFMNKDIIIYSTKFTINRADFGMNKYLPLIDNKVDITLFLEFIKQEEGKIN